MVETKINRQHRKVICDATILYLYLLPEDHIRRALDPAVNAFDDFVSELVEHCWTNLCSTFSLETFDITLRTSGAMTNNIKQILGQLVRSFESSTNNQIKGQPQIRERMQLVAQLHSELKGKDKADSSSKRQRVDEGPVERTEEIPGPAVAVQDVDITSTSPVLHLLTELAIFHLQAPQLGEGRYAVVRQIKVTHPLFKDDIYAAKIFKDQSANTPATHRALHEATAVPLQHPGMILPLALVRYTRKPILIFKLWNGGTLEQWLQACHHDGSRPAIKEYVNTSGNVEKFIDNILPIFNSLLSTIKYIHTHDFIHNDLHSRNILLHFGNRGVYAGIADWGLSTPAVTTNTFPKLPDLNPSTRHKFQSDFPWAAPENISTNPPPFTKATDIYSLCFLLKRLINCLPKPSDAPKQHFIRNIIKHLNSKKAHNPAYRPKIWDLSLCINGAHNVGYPIVHDSGLRPVDD